MIVQPELAIRLLSFFNSMGQLVIPVATGGFVFTDAGNGKITTVTYWITHKGCEKAYIHPHKNHRERESNRQIGRSFALSESLH